MVVAATTAVAVVVAATTAVAVTVAAGFLCHGALHLAGKFFPRNSFELIGDL